MRPNLFKMVVEDGVKYLLDYYVYSATFSALANGASQTQLINIEADADFIMNKIGQFSTIAGAAQTSSSRVVPLATLAINDSGSGRNLQNEPVFINSIAGQGELPFVLPLPRTFRANSTINLTVSNTSAGTTYEFIQISLIGYKKFMMGNA